MLAFSKFLVSNSILAAMCLICLTNESNIHQDYLNALSQGSVIVKTLSRPTRISSSSSDSSTLEIFCYLPSTKPKVIDLWMSTCFEIDCGGNYVLHFGRNASQAYHGHKESRLSLHYLLFSKSRRYCVHSFEESCLAVEATVLPFTIKLDIEELCTVRILGTLFGILLFFQAKYISKEAAFHYIVGTLIGTLTFILVTMVLVERLFANRTQLLLLAVVSAGGYLLIANWMITHLGLVVGEYLNYLLAYLAVTSLISFSICYVRGPVSNPRALNLLQWLLQALSLVVLFKSMSYEPYAYAVCLVAVASSFFRSAHAVGRT